QQLRDEKLEALEKAAKILLNREGVSLSLHEERMNKLEAALAMPTEVEARYYKKPGYEIHRINGDGSVEFYAAGEWLESGLREEQITEENGWTEYFPDAEEAVKNASKPYLPLPAPDLVVLGRGGEFLRPEREIVP